MADKWEKNNRVYRLNLDQEQDAVGMIEYALERVIAQPRGASIGNHALLIVAMKEVFNVNLNKRDAIEGALWCLWREDDIEKIESDDTYIAELKQEQADDSAWSDLADEQEDNKN